MRLVQSCIHLRHHQICAGPVRLSSPASATSRPPKRSWGRGLNPFATASIAACRCLASAWASSGCSKAATKHQECRASASSAADAGDCLRGTVSRCHTSVGIRCTFHVRRDCRSEEHTSELQSHVNLVCRLLLEKKKKNK